MTSSAPTVVISNSRPKVNPEDVTNTTCIRKGIWNISYIRGLRQGYKYTTILIKILLMKQQPSSYITNDYLPGCENLAIRNAEWEDEYCSNECVVAHCKDVFADWVAGNLSSETIKSA